MTSRTPSVAPEGAVYGAQGPYSLIIYILFFSIWRILNGERGKPGSKC